MIIFFQSILFLKEFLACNGCFGLFTKIKNGSGTSFWCTFSAWFFHKKGPCLILLSMDKVSMPYLFLLKISNKMCYEVLRQFMTSETLRFILDQPLKQWLTEKIREEGNLKTWISREWKELFIWNKQNIFHIFWRAIIWWKIKVL